MYDDAVYRDMKNDRIEDYSMNDNNIRMKMEFHDINDTVVVVVVLDNSENTK